MWPAIAAAVSAAAGAAKAPPAMSAPTGSNGTVYVEAMKINPTPWPLYIGLGVGGLLLWKALK